MNINRELVKAINNYDESKERFEDLRNLICKISDEKLGFDDQLTKELLYMASQKLRTFGYNILNELDLPDELTENNVSYIYRNEAINEFYTSETGIQLDKFQKEIIDTYQNIESKKMFVSAPTSFGKTFLIREIIFRNKERYSNILLIFPTISLLNENVDNFQEFVRKYDLHYKVISNTHMEIQSGNNIFILTPERVLKIMNDFPEIEFDFFFMDEIYKIDNFFETNDEDETYAEDERDKVFRIVLYLLSKSVKEFYLAGPYINLENLGGGLVNFLNKNEVTPFQIDTEFVNKIHIKSWSSQIYLEDNIKIKYGNAKTKIEKLLTIIQLIEERNYGATIVYAESKQKVTSLARECLILFEPIENQSLELKMFVDHLSKRYSVLFKNKPTHVYWTIIELLKRGIGVHHGAFPKYIQNAILEFFNGGELKTLFSTTSITEGVNTKAKNIIFYGTSKGRKTLKTFDIKNINGRAGRYYHHFVGRIFYLEKEVYDKLQEQGEKLDFVTFGEDEISNIDLDNADEQDLSEKNIQKKIQREELIKEYNIDSSVFVKNRLVDKLNQINLIQYLENKSTRELKSLVLECSNIGEFLRKGTLYKILGAFKEIGMLDDYEVKKFGKVASDYAKSNGLIRLIMYHLNEYKDFETLENSIVDKIYIDVFSNIRNIIEYKVPKFLSIFSNILKYVCSLPTKNINTESIAFESIIRFFELGVRSKLGLYLAEQGFPIPTIRNLETKLWNIMDAELPAIYNNWQILSSEFNEELDEFEYLLLTKIINKNL
ncbi:DEAD/DEAH box helicase [Rossellomorea sp. GAMAL-10_SWC]